MDPIFQKAPVLNEIARFIANPSPFDDKTIHQAKRVFADTKGVAFSGVKTTAFQMAFQSRLQLFGEDQAEIWATDKKSTLLGATFYNALSISSTDFDEGHRKAVGHPASLVVPVAQALGASLKKSFHEILEAVIVGYEIGTRFSNARVKEKITTYSSGRWGAIASAATAAYLYKLSPEKIMHALSLASVLSPAMLGGSTDVSTGSMAKEGVAWAAQSGLQSALLAKNGFVGPYVFVDEHDDFESNILLDGLGGSWLINSNYFKPYSCCRWLHTGIQAAIDLKTKHRFNPEDIRKVKVRVFERALALISSKYPENDIQAQFHMPYTIACGLLFDKVTPKHFSPFCLKNGELLSLIDKVELIPDETYTQAFPAKVMASVEVVLDSNQVYMKEVECAPWDADSQPTDEELKQKFYSQCGDLGDSIWNSIFEMR